MRGQRFRPAAALARAGLLVLCLAAAGCEERIDPVDIGSKNFTENVLLAEMMAQLVEQEGFRSAGRFRSAARSRTSRR
jgi:glycine betaine/choline ABC-type transport system substrate-binding protein